MTKPPASGCGVLQSLYDAVGSPSYADIVRRGELRGLALANGTITNLLAGTGRPRRRSVTAFVHACVSMGGRRLPAGQDTADYWIDLWDAEQPMPAGAAADARKPVRVGVPPPEARAFQRRDLGPAAQSEEGSRSEVITIIGAGGVGKTQAAAHLVREPWHDPDIVLAIWAAATSDEGLVSAYADAARQVLGDDFATAESAAQALLHWLSTTPDRWVVVIDDLQIPAELASWFPAGPNGQVIITSRYRGDALRRLDHPVVELGEFSSDESVAYLLARLGSSPESDANEKAVRRLASDLGNLPLALSQASAYILNEEISVDVYRDSLADRRRTLADLLPDRQELPDGYRETIVAMWSLSMDRVNTMQPVGVSVPILRIGSFLDPNGIPSGIFSSAACTELISQLTHKDISAHDIDRALTLCHRYSLVTYEPTARDSNVAIHALQQRATREAIVGSGGDGDLFSLAAGDAMTALWTDMSDKRRSDERWRSNALALIGNAGDHLWESGRQPLLLAVSESLGGVGLVHQAVRHLEHLARLAGSIRPRTKKPRPSVEDLESIVVVIAIHTRHAYWRDRAGDPSGAVDELSALMGEWTSELGEQHPFLWRARHTLAVCRGRAGRPAEAVTELEQLLREMRITGRPFEETLGVRSDLALWQGEAGRADLAAEQMQAIADQEMRRGANDGQILHAQYNAAYWRAKAGDPVGAVEEFERLIPAMREVLGPNDPNVMTAEGTMAYQRGEAGHAGEAVREFEVLLERQLDVLGPDHPETLATRNNLALWRGNSGDVRGAAQEFELVLAEMTRVLGPNHTRTLTAGGNLVRWRGGAGDPADAVDGHMQHHAKVKSILGPDHPLTLVSGFNLAIARAHAGDKETADRELEEMLADHIRVLGPGHVDTLKVQRSLKRYSAEAEDDTPRLEDLEELLNEHLSNLAEDHPHVLKLKLKVATTLGAEDRAAEGAEMARGVLTTYERLRGAGDSDTALARYLVAALEARTGNLDRATEEIEKAITDFVHLHGPSHEISLQARSMGAAITLRAGDRQTAETAYCELLADQISALGADHPDTQHTRSQIDKLEARTD